MPIAAPRLSFLVLTRERPRLLARCLETLLADLPGGVEVCVLFNGERPPRGAPGVLGAPPVRLFACARAPRGRARNLLAGAARGELLYFLDDDVELPPGFARRALAAFAEHPAHPVLGGPNLLRPGAPPFERAADFLLRSPLGAGPARVRHVPDAPEGTAPPWAFTLCGLGVRRAEFERLGGFPDGVASAEENLLLHSAGPARFLPGLAVLHRRRADYAGFTAQAFSCGKGRAEITRLRPASLQPFALAPLALAAAFLALPFSSFARALVLAYGAACLLETLRMAAAERDLAGALLLAPLFPAGHLAYAAGMFAGAFTSRAALARPAADAAPIESCRPSPIPEPAA